MYFPKEYDWNKEVSFQQVSDDLDKFFNERTVIDFTTLPRRVDICNEDYNEELIQSAKPKHKPFYKERNGKKLRKWEK